MNIEKKINYLDLNNSYKTEILGLGEIYEIMSIEKTRKNLLRKYPQGILYLSANKDHSQRGFFLTELENIIKEDGLVILEKGYVDSPPWASRPIKKENKKNLKKICLFRIIFWFLIKIEFIWKGPKHSHMIYCLAKK